MSFILSNTLGLVSPKYRNLSEWIAVYKAIVNTGDRCQKTKENRNRHIDDINCALGAHTLSTIRPCDISQYVNSESKIHPQKAKRLLVELRCMFNAAMENGWIDINPAISIRTVKAPTLRQRLTLEMWRKMYLSVYDDDNWNRRLLTLALMTGQRRGDLVKMRFSDIHDGCLHITQEKTGVKLALPLRLRLPAVSMSLAFVIKDCFHYAKNPDYMLRKSTGAKLSASTLSYRFECIRDAAMPEMTGSHVAPSLHECRSLAARLYNGVVDTQTLLGHTNPIMTALYLKERNLKNNELKVLEI